MYTVLRSNEFDEWLVSLKDAKAKDRRNNLEKFRNFDVSDYLDAEEAIAEYLTAALEDENPDVFLAALADVAKARGMSKVAQSTGLGRESLYKALAPGAKPRFDTILKILHGLGVKIAIIP